MHACLHTCHLGEALLCLGLERGSEGGREERRGMATGNFNPNNRQLPFSHLISIHLPSPPTSSLSYTLPLPYIYSHFRKKSHPCHHYQVNIYIRSSSQNLCFHARHAHNHQCVCLTSSSRTTNVAAQCAYASHHMWHQYNDFEGQEKGTRTARIMCESTSPTRDRRVSILIS